MSQMRARSEAGAGMASVGTWVEGCLNGAVSRGGAWREVERGDCERKYRYVTAKGGKVGRLNTNRGDKGHQQQQTNVSEQNSE